MSVDTVTPVAPVVALPWWERLLNRILPSNKGWMTIAVVVILFYVLWMIHDKPSLLNNASFMQFAGVVGASSFALVLSHFFGGTKTGGDVMAANARTVNASAAASSGTGSGTPTVTPPDAPKPRIGP